MGANPFFVYFTAGYDFWASPGKAVAALSWLPRYLPVTEPFCVARPLCDPLYWYFLYILPIFYQ